MDSTTFPDNALSAIVWSACWIEALTNDVVYWLLKIDPAHFSEREKQLRALVRSLQLDRQAPIRAKLAAFYVPMRGGEFPADQSPWREFLLIYQLRNQLVHQRPEIFTVKFVKVPGGTKEIAARLHDLLEQLVIGGVVPRPPEETFNSLFNAMRTHAVAKWAFANAQRVSAELLDLFPAGELRTVLTPSVGPVLELSV